MGPESTNRKIVGVIFFAWFLYSVSLSLSLSLSLSRSLALSPLSLSISLSLSLCLSLSRCLSLSLTLINNYIHAYMCLTVGRQSRDHRPLSRDPSVNFHKKFPNCVKRPKTLFDSQPTVAWPPTTGAWPFSDFFQNFPKSLETSKKRCLTVSRRSRDLRPLSRDRSTTFFENFHNCLKIPKKTLFDSQPTVAWPPTTVAWPFSDFYQKIF